MPKRVIETCIYSKKLDEMKRFYSDILGLEVVGTKNEAYVFFKVGESMLLVFNPKFSTDSERMDLPLHGGIVPNGLHFAMEASDKAEFSYYKDKLARNGINLEHEQKWKQGSHSIYFRDPENNLIELISSSPWPIEK